MLIEWLTVSWLVHCEKEMDMKWSFKSQFLMTGIEDEVVERTKLYWIQVLWRENLYLKGQRGIEKDNPLSLASR